MTAQNYNFMLASMYHIKKINLYKSPAYRYGELSGKQFGSFFLIGKYTISGNISHNAIEYVKNWPITY